MGVMNSMQIGLQGLNAHGRRIEISAKNIANLDTPNYVRKISVLKAEEDNPFATFLNTNTSIPGDNTTVGGVSFTGTVQDPTPQDKVYMPGHPDADEDGFVKMSNVDPLVDIADAKMAQRAYEASISVMSMAKTMAQRALEIGS